MCPINLSVLFGYLRKHPNPRVRRRARVMVSIPIGPGPAPRLLISHTLEISESGVTIQAPSSSLHEIDVGDGREMSITLSLPAGVISVRALPVSTRSFVENGAKISALDLKITAIGDRELDQLRAFLARCPE